MISFWFYFPLVPYVSYPSTSSFLPFYYKTTAPRLIDELKRNTAISPEERKPGNKKQKRSAGRRYQMYMKKNREFWARELEKCSSVAIRLDSYGGPHPALTVRV